MLPPRTELVCTTGADSPRGAIPIARMRSVYRLDEVERRLGKLAGKEHENLRAT